MTGIRKYWIALIFTGLGVVTFAQHEDQQQPEQATENHDKTSSAETGTISESPEGDSHGCGHSMEEKEGEFNSILLMRNLSDLQNDDEIVVYCWNHSKSKIEFWNGYIEFIQ